MNKVFKIEVDIQSFGNSLDILTKEVEQAINEGAQKLAVATHAHIVELAQSELHVTREKYLDALSFEEIAANVYVVSFDMDKMGWLEEGKPEGSMVDDLLRKGSKTSKDGHRYKAIPFEHSKPPSQLNEKARNYLSLIKSELKKRNIPYKKLELGPDGSPLIGKLHRFNIDSTYPTARAKTPALHGLTIYQEKNKKTGKVERKIMTFRMVTDKHKQEGLWYHPGVQAKKFLDKSTEWAMNIFESEILPHILNRLDSQS